MDSSGSEEPMNKRLLQSVALLMVLILAAGCGKETVPLEATLTESADAAVSEDTYIFFLNDDPQRDTAWRSLASTWTRRTGVPVTIESVPRADYSVRLQAAMAERFMPTLFLLTDENDSYVWDDYTTELTGTLLDRHLRFHSLYEFQDGKAAAAPGVKGAHFAVNARCSGTASEATLSFLCWAVSSAEGRSVLGDTHFERYYY